MTKISSDLKDSMLAARKAIFFLFLLQNLLSSVSFADQEDTNWYQIEVILFANEAGQWQNSELWRDQFDLLYPDKMVLLKPYKAYEFEPFDYDFESLRRTLPEVLEEFDSDFSHLKREYLSPEMLAERELERALEQQLALEQEAQATEEVVPFPADAPNDELNLPFGSLFDGEPSPDVNPKPVQQLMNLERDEYLLLPDQLLQLRQTAQKIKDAYDLRLLAHLAWRQIAVKKNGAVPVLLQTGDQFDLNFELEGLLMLSENRYLHVDSALYFSRFERALVTGQADWSSFYQPQTRTRAPFHGGIGTQTLESNANLFDQPTNNFKRSFTAASTSSRRVRTGELHYIDHPLFGILVLVSDYRLPDPVLKMREFRLDRLPNKRPVPFLSAPLSVDEELPQ